MFTNAAPVSGGIGMFLLQKMGWKQGEGLGKNNEGQKEPLMLDFKVDRKGNTCIRLCLLSHKVFVAVFGKAVPAVCTNRLAFSSRGKHL